MKSPSLLLVLAITAGLLFMSLHGGCAETKRTTMTAGLEKDSSGKTASLTVKGNVAEEKAYLCVTLYRKGFNKDAWWSEGYHIPVMVKKGAFEKRVAIGEYRDGAYEASLFKSIVGKDKCAFVKKSGCWFCESWGYHMADMLAYCTDVIK